MTSSSAIEEVVATLHAVIGELDDAGHATNDAVGKAGEDMYDPPRRPRPRWLPRTTGLWATAAAV